ncbi:hypothetical protein CH365_06480 [Leptospira neocaledonica]|uniref:Uncharacterized protein n=1 Tax=Leptospira neocaledonica TaxID=2023192 RepID=A0A2N0A169_9LEPT|nr:hypothetical protein CH365_06480 [Leptospira neocaledonica]
MNVQGKSGRGVQSSEEGSCFLFFNSVFFSFGASVISLPIHSNSEKSIFRTGFVSVIQPNCETSKVTQIPNKKRL